MASQTLREENSERILVVDDACGTRQMIALQLERAGYTTLTASSGVQALELVRRQGLPRLALLDLSLPGMSGLALADALRVMGDLPIVLLSPLSYVTTLAEGMAYHAEDYLIKPFTFGELQACIERVLARAEVPPMDDLESVIDSYLRVNFVQQYLMAGERQVALTPTETRLLHLLYCHRGRVVSPGYLMSKAWDVEQQGTLGSLWVHIRRLRNKLEVQPDSPRYLLTVRGQGYTLQMDGVMHS
jgi:DNA-binding response OmpR family regulator